MWTSVRDTLANVSMGELVAGAVIFLAAAALVISSVIYAYGDEVAFFGLLAAFAVGTTGVGIHIASREARLRRSGRVAIRG